MERKKYFLLLAGSPGTGKTYLLNLLKEKFPTLFVVTPDEIKECVAESIGFDSQAEKEILEKTKIWPMYYQILSLYMEMGKKVVVSEYPFSDKQKKRLQSLAKDYGYQVITIRLTASFETLWQRRYQRDRDPERHLSFIMEGYHYGDELIDRNAATNQITKEEFFHILQERKYEEFSLGELIEINVEDFEKVDYSQLLDGLVERITNNR